MTDASWKLRGLCRKFTAINFVPDPFLGEDSLPAKRVCEHCPVIEQCRAYGQEHDLVGVWGGEDEVDRLRSRTDSDPTTCVCDERAVAVPTTMGAVCTTCGRVA